MASLAPPSSPAPHKAHRNLDVPRPQPASSRPRKAPHQLPVWNLVKVPFRLLSPPKATGMVGSVRSLKATPMSDVRLADVIANKHLSPLSLKDFEGYLVFKEYSAENLYFILWLNEYEKEFAAYVKDSSIPKKEAQPTLNTDPYAPRTAEHLPSYLAQSLRRGLDVFFAPDGPLELNLPRATRDRILVEAGNSGDPKDFAEARDIIEHSLNRSLAAHTKTCVANAGPRRLVFCWSLGFSVFLLGLIPPFVGIFGHHARGYRAIGLPFLGLGMAIMVMAINRLCAVIWLLGEDRQLLPWELASPTVTSGSIVPINCPTTPSSTCSPWEDESSLGGYGDDSKSPESSFRTQTSANPYPWEKQDAELSSTPAVAEVDFTPSSPTSSSRPPSYRSGGTTSRGVVPGSAPVFGPVTSVFSPDVVRAQWRLAIYAFGIGLITICTVGVVLMAVPNQ